MKPFIPSRIARRAALVLPALGLMLASPAAQGREHPEPDRQRQSTQQLQERGGGRGGSIEEFNFGPTGMDVILQRGDPRDEGDARLLSGRVIELRGQTLYVEREGVVVPLNVSALRFQKQPKEGQRIIASYEVDRTDNIALSLMGEVEPSPGAE